MEQKSPLFIFSSVTPQRTASSKVPSQMAAHLRTAVHCGPGQQFFNLVSLPMSHHCSHEENLLQWTVHLGQMSLGRGRCCVKASLVHSNHWILTQIVSGTDAFIAPGTIVSTCLLGLVSNLALMPAWYPEADADRWHGP